MPSKWEGFGLAAIEGMALGKPVLASPVGGLKDIVTDDSGALCKSINEFADAAIELLTNETLYFRKSESAKLRVEQYGNQKQYFDKVEKAYHKNHE
jgi:glycosyltransferase involved in cell wall biosynthesis